MNRMPGTANYAAILQRYFRFEYNDSLPDNTHLDSNLFPNIHDDTSHTDALHFISLLGNERELISIMRDQSILNPISTQRAHCIAGNRIFGDADCGCKYATMSQDIRILNIQGESIKSITLNP